ncbi:hypothetical protein ACHQM5_028532 [Ranunculus cassubicifolius]
MKTFALFVFLFFSLGLTSQYEVDQGNCLKKLFSTKLQLERTRTEWTTPTALSHFESPIKYEVEDNLIDGLPGQPSEMDFKQYSGYVTVDEASGRNLFYYFVEAEGQNTTIKPLVLWLNGGPGCSSLGIGAMVEHGPFGIKNDGKSLYLRRHSWNKVANILYLESPVGVGFSYSNTKSDYESMGDTRTAQDTYAFLVKWFQRFPHYRTSDLFIAGESYAGHYIPELVDIIQSKSSSPLSLATYLKGIMIGNGVADTIADLTGMFDYIRSHVMISEETHAGLVETCARKKLLPKCNDFLLRTKYEMGPIDLFSIVSGPCDSSSTKKSSCKHETDPCEKRYVGVYLNLPEVQKALHVKLPHTWGICSMVSTNWTDTPSSVLPIYRKIMKTRVKILLYSGDMDGVVPVTSTEYAIRALNLTIKNSWRPWVDSTGEVAGYRVDYDGLTFATVRGAGHEVPRYQPARAFSLLKWFVEGA